ERRAGRHGQRGGRAELDDAGMEVTAHGANRARAQVDARGEPRRADELRSRADGADLRRLVVELGESVARRVDRPVDGARVPDRDPHWPLRGPCAGWGPVSGGTGG